MLTRFILATLMLAPVIAQAQPTKTLECKLIASDVESVYCVKMENVGFRCVMQNKYQGEAGPRVGVDIKAKSSASIFVNDGRPGTKDYVLNCVAK